jgi:hypothetical protein
MIRMPEQTECAGEGEWKHIAASQAGPDSREPRHPLRVWDTRKISRIDRADRCADDEIRLHARG